MRIKPKLGGVFGWGMAVALFCGTSQAGDKPETFQVITWEAPKEIEASPLYKVTVNGKPVFVYPCKVGTIADEKGNLRPDRHQISQAAPAAFCYFDFTGKVDVAITVLGGSPTHLPLKTATVRPLRHGITPTVAESTMRFELDRPCKLAIEPNGSILAPLFFFASAPEASRPSPKDPNVMYFGPGVHELGFFDQVKSNMTIYIAGGAVVYGHIWGSHVANVKVLGRGILDGSRSNDSRLMRWFKSSDITVDGIILLDSPSWGVEVSHSDRVTLRNLKINNYRGACDGIDVCSSEDVTVDDCFLRTHDDTLNVKGLTDVSWGYPADENGRWSPRGVRKAARHIRFLNCVVWNDRAHALMIGPETRALEIRDVLYRNIDIIHALSVHALAIFSGDSAPISDIRYEDIRIEDPRCFDLFGIRVHSTYVTADSTFGPVSNVVYRNIQVTTPTPVYSMFCADSNTISDVTFENLRINGALMTNAAAAKVLMRGDIKNVRFVTGAAAP